MVTRRPRDLQGALGESGTPHGDRGRVAAAPVAAVQHVGSGRRAFLTNRPAVIVSRGSEGSDTRSRAPIALMRPNR